MEVQMKSAVGKPWGRRCCEDKQMELNKFIMVSTGQKDKIYL